MPPPVRRWFAETHAPFPSETLEDELGSAAFRAFVGTGERAGRRPSAGLSRDSRRCWSAPGSVAAVACGGPAPCAGPAGSPGPRNH
jgi:hypothetical protein